jgi:MFS superfamily sulfate permease-like transporter
MADAEGLPGASGEPAPPMPGDTSRLRHLLSELAGAFGDFGTIVPLILAAAVVCSLPLAPILLFFGIWFIATGLIYRLPVPVEPMKAIAAVAIAGALGAGEIAAAGLVLGVLFLVLSSEGWMTGISRYIPESVLRGIQLALALLLLRTSFGFLAEDPRAFLIAVAVIAGGLLLSLKTRIPDLSALAVIGLGLIAGIFLHGFPGFQLMAVPALVIPGWGDLSAALAQMVVPQAILTVTNAILATSLLTKDLFRSEVSPARLSRTIGLMNLTSVPFGGFPMCHGAGGLAGQYRFGARTGVANVFAGLVFLSIALFFASPQVLTLIPAGIFGALLLYTSLELGRHSLKRDSWFVAAVMGGIALLSSMTVAFVAGLALAWGLIWWERRARSSS